MLNSCSTVFTMDLYKPFFGRHKSEQHLVLVGRISAFVILVMATVLAIWFSYRKLGVFTLIQDIGAWVAAPIAAVFLLGVLWRRTTAWAATFVLLFAFPLHRAGRSTTCPSYVSWLMPFGNCLNRTFLVWAVSMLLLVLLSLVTKPPDPEKIKGIIWSWNVGEAAGIGARTKPRRAESVSVVVHLHGHHGRPVRLYLVVSVRGTGQQAAVRRFQVQVVTYRQ